MKNWSNYIFDLYGTLVDIKTNENKKSLWEKTALMLSMQGAAYTGTGLKKRYRELTAEQAGKLLEEKQRSHKDILLREQIEISLENVISLLYQEKGVEAAEGQIRDLLLAFRSISLEYICLYDGVKELLDDLRREGKRIYLLSNAQRMFTEPEMRMLGIYQKFDDILYSSDIGFKKPSCHFYDALFRMHGLKKEESVMIGNEYAADILGSCEYGIDSIYIYTKQSGDKPDRLPVCCREISDIRDISDKNFRKEKKDSVQ